MDFVCIVQARSNSSRFKNKIFNKIGNYSILEIILKRLKKSKLINNIVVATTTNKIDNKVVTLCNKLKVNYFRGSETNVLQRYYLAAIKFKAKNIIRITADCPLVDWQIIDKMILKFKNKKIEYINNCSPLTFPDGLDVEIFSFKILEKIHKNFRDNLSKEHVTIRINEIKKIKKNNFINNKDLSHFRWTIDEPQDLYEVKKIFSFFKNKINFSFSNIVKALNSKKLILPNTNNHITRNEGSNISKYKKLWISANRVIAGGNMLISKRPDRFSGDTWPTYFKKSKKIYVWDYFNKKYLDFSLMGVGTNILGYGNKYVDEAVKKTINEGNVSTLNTYDEVKLAEKMISIHAWSDMAKFARSGGEANAIAVRLARIATNKEKIAVCGYHGWHDWYLSLDLLSQKSLGNLLFPGISMRGIPSKLKGTVIPFEYNNFEQLEKIVVENDLAAIKMEVQRNHEPKNNFLKKIRKLCDKKKIVLIFDECTSGFRETYGGLHLKYNVNPDLAVFGKALGNGYAITSILGKKEIMNQEKNTFISSTFWSERIGFSAALKTLEIMENIESWKIISRRGLEIKKLWKSIAKDNGIKMEISGLSSIPKFEFLHNNNENIKLFIINEMLKKNYLASNLLFLSTEHKLKIIQKYIDDLNGVFHNLKNSIDIDKKIDLEITKKYKNKNFKRLN